MPNRSLDGTYSRGDGFNPVDVLGTFFGDGVIVVWSKGRVCQRCEIHKATVTISRATSINPNSMVGGNRTTICLSCLWRELQGELKEV